MKKWIRNVRLILFTGCLAAGIPAFATVYNITNTADGNALNQLRGALSNADQSAGPHTINLPAGTYNITLGTILIGNRAQTISIVGAGASNTIINMAGTGANRDRILFINPPGTISNVSTSISGVKFTNGYLTSDTYGGGAISAGGPYNTLTLTNCEFSNNTMAPSAGTYGGAICIAGGGTTTISGCVFTNNQSSSLGGAVCYFLGSTNGSPGTFNLNDSRFANNTGANGGALAVENYGGGNVFSCSIQRNVFLNNVATSTTNAYGGGAIQISNSNDPNSGIAAINYNRFSGNTATSANSSRSAVSAGNPAKINLTNNWWGCNSGATISGCADKAGVDYSANNPNLLSLTPYLQLKTTIATPSCIGIGTDVTTGFTSNSAGNTISAANLTALVGAAVSFAASNGTISNAQSVIQSTGTATATLTPTANPATVNAVVDNTPSTDATARGSVAPNPSTAISTQPPASNTVCNGGNITIGVSATGSGTLSYQWYKGGTALSSGATGNGSVISGNTSASLTISGATAADAATNYYVVVSSSVCNSATSGNAALTVNSPASITSQPSSTTPCPGTTAVFSVSASGTGPLSYQWYKGGTALSNGGNISGATTATLSIASVSASDNAADYNVKVINSCNATGATSNNVSLTTITKPAVSVTSSYTTCAGTTLNLNANATGNAMPFSFQWQKTGVNLSNGPTGSGATLTGTTTSTLSITNIAGGDAATDYLVVVTNGCGQQQASGNISVTVEQPGVWLGSVDGLWSRPANWKCNTVPTSNINVTIPANTPNDPLIDISTATANNITIAAGASLGFTGANSTLTINGTLTATGAFNASTGKVVFAGTNQSIASLTYKSLEINGGSSSTLAGPVTVLDVLTLTNGYLVLGNNNLTIGSVGSISGASSASFVVANGTGKLFQYNVGAGGRTGNILFPVGTNSGSYTPLQMSNSGTADHFSLRLLDNVYDSYDAAENPTGAVLNSQVVNRTWLLNEATAGGSNVTITLQWNAANETAGFARNTAILSHYTGGIWTSNGMPATAASGSNPYSLTRGGFTSFSPFGVGGGAGNPLPVKLIDFTAKPADDKVVLGWTVTDAGDALRYDVERSEDGNAFQTLASLASNSVGKTEMSYAYTDSFPPAAPVLYYRLRILDVDGSVSFSATLPVKQTLEQKDFKAYPNPVSGNTLFLQQNGLSGGEKTIVIRNAQGVICHQQTLSINNPEVGSIDISALPAGIYFLSCKEESGSGPLRFVRY